MTVVAAIAAIRKMANIIATSAITTCPTIPTTGQVVPMNTSIPRSPTFTLLDREFSCSSIYIKSTILMTINIIRNRVRHVDIMQDFKSDITIIVTTVTVI